MAVGNVSIASNVKRTIELSASITADVAAPTLATQGVPTYPAVNEMLFGSETGCFFSVEPPHAKSLLSVKVGGTTPSTILTIWGYLEGQAAWFPAASVKAGAAITANYVELIEGLGHYDRLAVQAGTTSGTLPTFDVRLTTTQRSGK